MKIWNADFGLGIEKIRSKIQILVSAENLESLPK